MFTRRSRSLPARFLLAAAMLTAAILLAQSRSMVDFRLSEWHQGHLQHPTDAIVIGGELWVTELYRNRLVRLDRETDGQFAAGAPTVFAEGIKAPHFLAIDSRHLYASEGWGRAVVRVDPQLAVVVSTVETGTTLNAPHGLCVADGRIHIADSLNSRLVRVGLDGGAAEVFGDEDRRVGYVRQLLCTDRGLFLANTYERREGINPGEGSNILLVEDFENGKVREIAAYRGTGTTGLALATNRYLVVSLWHAGRILVYDLEAPDDDPRTLEIPDGPTGPPYGLYYDEHERRLYASFMGDIFEHRHHGGIAVYSLESRRDWLAGLRALGWFQ